MSRFGLLMSALHGEWERAVKSEVKPLGRASSQAMHDVVDLAVIQGSRAILRAGFSAKWALGLRGKVFGDNDDKLAPVGFVWHKIGYAGIFQSGGVIVPRQREFLWAPIEDNLPPNIHHPFEFVDRVGKLDFVPASAGHKPLLVGTVPVNQVGRVLSAPLKNPTTARGFKRRSRFFVRSPAVKVPLFVGFPLVHEPKKFEVDEAVEEARKHYAEFLNRHLQGS